MKKKILAIFLSAVMMLSAGTVGSFAKTNPDGQVVGTTMFYLMNSNGERILVAQIPIGTMESDMQSGKIDQTLHNYSLLDRYVTTVHQEAQGFTAGEYVSYAQSKSTDAALKALKLSFEGNDRMAFWEMDDTDYDNMDTYSYKDLYGTQRYNFPLLYKYWNYKTQDYYDPDGKMSKEEVIEHIFKNGVPETFLLSVRAYSQRYIATDEKYGELDYDLENYWQSKGLLDNERTIRMMVGMTEEELRNATPTASNTRYWIQSVLLDMDKDPTIASKGKVAEPTAVVTEDANYYYVKYSCATEGATIYYNHNFKNVSYMPTKAYDGTAVKIDKSIYPDGKITLTAHAVKDGYTDAGVVTLNLKSSGTGAPAADTKPQTTVQPQTASGSWTDVASGKWYEEAVNYVTENGLFDNYGKAKGGSDTTTFGPEENMTRQMLVTALYRMAGSPEVSGTLTFKDVPAGAAYYNALLWAKNNEIVSGRDAEGTVFAPDDSITREEITKMFYCYAKNNGADMSKTKELSGFSDASQISKWAVDYVKWAAAAGVVNGNSDGTFAPKGTATRAQMAQMILNYVGK